MLSQDASLGANARARKYHTRFMRVWGYIGIGIIVIAVCWSLGHFGDAINMLVTGGVLAFIYAPIVNGLERRFKVPRLLGTVIGLLTVIVAAAVLLLVLLPPIIDQIAGLVSALPGFVKEIQQLWEQFNEYLALNPEGQVQKAIAGVYAQAEQFAGRIAQSAASGIFSGATSLVSSFVLVFMSLVVSFWLAKDFPRIERELSVIAGPRRGEDYRIVTSVFGRSLAGYLKGMLITSTCTGCLAGLGFWLLGVPYSLLLGVLTGVLNFVPYIGPWTVGAFAFIVGLSVSPAVGFFSIVVSVVAQQFTDNLISPKVMQSAVALHPVLVLTALTAGGALGGILGMIAAVPLTAAIKGTFVYYFEKKTGRQLMSRDGMLFKGEPFCDEEGNPRPACDALGVDIEGEKGVPRRIVEAYERERHDHAAGDLASEAPGHATPAPQGPSGDEAGPHDGEKAGKRAKE